MCAVWEDHPRSTSPICLHVFLPCEHGGGFLRADGPLTAISIEGAPLLVAELHHTQTRVGNFSEQNWGSFQFSAIAGTMWVTGGHNTYRSAVLIQLRTPSVVMVDGLDRPMFRRVPAA